MKALLYIFFILFISCDTIKNNKQEWIIVYPIKNDSTIIRVRGLYISTGKLFFNDGTNMNMKNEFLGEKSILFKPTDKQILMAESIVVKNFGKYSGKYKKFYRQYTSYICQNRDTIVVINYIRDKTLNRSQKQGKQNDFVLDDIIYDDDNVVIGDKTKFKARSGIFFVNLTSGTIMSTSTYFCYQPVRRTTQQAF